LKQSLDERIASVARAVAAAGGRALVVGGWVRDGLLGLDSKDVDVEVLGLSRRRLAELLADLGPVIRVGRSYDVFRLRGLEAEFSLPAGEAIPGTSDADYAEAARRRDLRINAMAWDPLSEVLLDPHGGRGDLEARRLRAVAPASFGSDPLRALRVAQFSARFEMRADAELAALCADLDLADLPAERIFEELRKLLSMSRHPSSGFEFLQQTHLLRFFPELDALTSTPQDPHWHPEGDVWHHTLLVIDEAARLRRHDEDDLALMWAALCHDLGKPLATLERDGRVLSPGHDRLGVDITQQLLERLRAPRRLTRRVCALVRHHLAPALFVKNGAGPRGYRRLARRLAAAEVSLDLLLRLARADHLGRTTEEALARLFPAGDRFLAESTRLGVDSSAPVDVVQGRHLIARGISPGPEFGRILRRCRALQDRLGERDPERILASVLGNSCADE